LSPHSRTMKCLGRTGSAQSAGMTWQLAKEYGQRGVESPHCCILMAHSCRLMPTLAEAAKLYFAVPTPIRRSVQMTTGSTQRDPMSLLQRLRYGPAPWEKMLVEGSLPQKRFLCSPTCLWTTPSTLFISIHLRSVWCR
jgi:hypothetical protein